MKSFVRPISSFVGMDRIAAEGWKARWYRLTGNEPEGFHASPTDMPDRLEAVAALAGARKRTMKKNRKNRRKDDD